MSDTNTDMVKGLIVLWRNRAKNLREVANKLERLSGESIESANLKGFATGYIESAKELEWILEINKPMKLSKEHLSDLVYESQRKKFMEAARKIMLVDL